MMQRCAGQLTGRRALRLCVTEGRATLVVVSGPVAAASDSECQKAAPRSEAASRRCAAKAFRPWGMAETKVQHLAATLPLPCARRLWLAV